MMSTYSDLILFYLSLCLATHRSTGKLLSILTHLFTELAQKGFCLPKELIEEAAGEGATEFHDYEGGGIGEGEGMKDVSDKIENEDQIEDTLKKGEDKEKEDPDNKPDVKEEDNAIEMSEDFDGKIHDGELQKKEEDDESNSDEEELDKQMGDLGNAEADKLDERLWGDDDDDNEENEDESDKTEETGPGMDTGESELVAKDDNLDADNKSKEDKKQQVKDDGNEEQAEESPNKQQIHEQIDEREYDENETDPYHGNQENKPEPEALDLPDNLNLENEEDKNSGDEKEEGNEEENPYDVEGKPLDMDDKDKHDEEPDEGNPEEGNPEEGNPEEEQESTNTEKNASEQIGEDGKDAENPDQDENEQNEEENQQPMEEEQMDTDLKDEENRLPTDQGILPKVEEETPEKEEGIPDSTERMEHDSCGQTAEENLQSESAAELAGSAAEKEDAKEDHGTGAADASHSEGHESKLMARLASQKESVKTTQSIKRKPGQSDDERSLGDHSQQVHKRLRIMDSSSEMGDRSNIPEHKSEQADAYEHIKQDAVSYDAQTYDVASKEQEKAMHPMNEEDGEENPQEEEDAMEMEPALDEKLEAIDVEKLKPEELTSNLSKTQGPGDVELESQMTKTEEDFDTTERNQEKEKSERSTESSIHTALQFLTNAIQQIDYNPEELREMLEKQLEAWQTQSVRSTEEEKTAAEMWQRYLLLTAPLSQQLCEQLRLILEPTQAAKLKGDFRTGKRLNMRKVIPYIASQFRKDKIWLRRTKPSKRQYQICLAIDDSSSMVDNHSKQLAYESLAVIGNALTLLEVGQIAVYSFGENVKLLHPFHEQFSDQSGSRILSLCKFQQKKTLIAQFLESSVPMFAAAQQLSLSSNPETAQLLLIVSDGRGLFVEGKDRVSSAVQAARNANIFVIFIILDNPTSKDSVMDIKVPIFTEAGAMPKMISYMEQFPFPFYIILRDVNALPETLSDALRQWFELVTTSENV